MNQNLWKPAPIRAGGGRWAPCRIFWPKFLWYPALILGALMMVLALRVGASHALEGHGWQKVGPAPGFAAYSADHSPKWDKPLTTLAGDNDDDDDGGDDDPTS
jgi:hypothetical protein